MRPPPPTTSAIYLLNFFILSTAEAQAHADLVGQCPGPVGSAAPSHPAWHPGRRQSAPPRHPAIWPQEVEAI